MSSIKIPPRPDILAELSHECAQVEPDIRKISQLIGRDVALTATMIKTVNSPFFGLHSPVETTHQAVVTMGIDSVINIITGFSLKNTLGATLSLDRFWDCAEKTASVAAYLSRAISNKSSVSADLAHLYALFHDCGIPLLMQKFPDYKETLQLARESKNEFFTEVEDKRHLTNHATLGYLFAKSWFLPKTVSQAILHHHDLSIFSGQDNLPDEVCTLIAIGCMAEHIVDFRRMRVDTSWEKVSHIMMNHLWISEVEFDEIKEEIVNHHPALQ